MAHNDRFGRTQPETEGAWVKVGRKHYRHESGYEVAYDCNAWGWYIVQERQPGSRFFTWDRLWVAQSEVERRAAAAADAPNVARLPR